MLKRDFILRMIEEIAKFVALVLKLRNKGETSRAYDEIKTMTGNLIGVSYDELIRGETTENSLSVKEGYKVEYMDAKGQFFFTAGEVVLSLGNVMRHNDYLRLHFSFIMQPTTNRKIFSFQRQVICPGYMEYLDSMGCPGDSPGCSI